MAQIKNIVIDQGSTHIEYLDIKVLTDNTLPFNTVTNPYIPMVFTNYTGQLQVRKTPDNSAPVLNLTSGNGITLSTNGRVIINISAAQSSSIIFQGDRAVYYYDLLLTNGATSTRVVEGTFTIKRAITHA